MFGEISTLSRHSSPDAHNSALNDQISSSSPPPLFNPANDSVPLHKPQISFVQSSTYFRVLDNSTNTELRSGKTFKIQNSFFPSFGIFIFLYIRSIIVWISDLFPLFLFSSQGFQIGRKAVKLSCNAFLVLNETCINNRRQSRPTRHEIFTGWRIYHR